MADDMSEGSEEEITTIASPEVVDKYKSAAAVANAASAYVSTLCVPGASVLDICKAGDDFIVAETAKVFAKKKFLKGVAFPTSISINNVICNFSPLTSDPPVILAEGDVLKIDLGAHFDGYVSQVGHTVVCTANPAQPIVGKPADVICAAHFAAECALRLCRPGYKASQITKVVKDVADVFQCKPVVGLKSHRVERFEVESEKSILNGVDESEEKDKKEEDIEFEENEVYILDILMSTGEGKARPGDHKTTIYRRTGLIYNCKVQASRYVLTEANKRFNKLPFTLRSLDERRGQLGIKECLKNDLVAEYPVLYEKEGEIVAHFRFTVLLLPNSIQKLNTYNLPYVQSQYSITDPALSSILQMGLKRKSNAKKKKKKKKKATAPAPMETD